MARKPRFPPEPVTRPDKRTAKGPTTHRSGPAPKDAREKAEAPTLPPPPSPSGRASARTRRTDQGRVSGMQNVKPSMPAATVDEVTADMSKDPRHERDDFQSGTETDDEQG
jgi:hypothetical protein